MHGIYIALNDLRITLKDRKVTTILILMPIILMTVLGTALTSAFESETLTDVRRIPIAVVKGEESNLNALEQFIPKDQIEDLQSSISDLNINQIIIDKVLEAEDVKDLLFYEILDKETALSKLKDKQIAAAVFLPHQFTNSYIMGRKSEIRIITHTDSELDKMILYAIFKGVSHQLSLPRIAITVAQEENIKEGIGSFSYADNGRDMEGLFQTNLPSLQFQNITVTGKKPVTSKEYYTTAIAVMFMLFSAGYGLVNMLQDRNHLTLARQLITGASKLQILLGKFLYTLFLCLIQLIILFTYAYFAMGIRLPSDSLAFIFLLVSSSFAVAGLSVFLCGFVKSQRGAVIFQSLVINILSLLGGSFIPIEVMPKIFRPLADLTPNGRAARAFLHLIEGGHLQEIVPSILMLLGFGCLCLLIGVSAFHPTER